MPDKRDYLRDLKHLYAPSPKDVTVVDVPPMNFLMIDGRGDPNTAPEYKQAVEALFSLAYALKFAIKKAQGIDYKVMPLEGLWWVEDATQYNGSVIPGDRANWLWTMMIMQPDPVTADLIERVRAEVARKKNPPSLPRIRFERFPEGPSAQILHVGPFSAEQATIDRLFQFIDSHGYDHNGKHHEIYLSDFTKTAPERLKTVIRHPIKARGE